MDSTLKSDIDAVFTEADKAFAHADQAFKNADKLFDSARKNGHVSNAYFVEKDNVIRFKSETWADRRYNFCKFARMALGSLFLGCATLRFRRIK